MPTDAHYVVFSLGVCTLHLWDVSGGGEGSGHGVRVGRFAFLFGFVLSAWGLPVFWGHFFFLPLLIYRAQRLFPPPSSFSLPPFVSLGGARSTYCFFPPVSCFFFSFFGFAYLASERAFFFPHLLFPFLSYSPLLLLHTYFNFGLWRDTRDSGASVTGVLPWMMGWDGQDGLAKRGNWGGGVDYLFWTWDGRIHM